MDASIFFLIGCAILVIVIGIGIPALAFSNGYSVEETPKEYGYSATPAARIGGVVMVLIACIPFVLTIMAMVGGTRIGDTPRGEG